MPHGVRVMGAGTHAEFENAKAALGNDAAFKFVTTASPPLPRASPVRLAPPLLSRSLLPLCACVCVCPFDHEIVCWCVFCDPLYD